MFNRSSSKPGRAGSRNPGRPEDARCVPLTNSSPTCITSIRLQIGSPPSCDIGQVNKSAGTPAYVDPLYGNCWSWTPAHGAAVYGRTDDLPVGPLDELASGAFLRVPFRRVPVIEVSSIEEVRAIAGRVKSGDPNFSGVWRGQSSHYTTEKTGRTKDELLRLYGAEDVESSPLCCLPQRELICTSRTASVHGPHCWICMFTSGCENWGCSGNY